MWKWLHQFGSPQIFYRVSGYCIPIFGIAALLLFLLGLYDGLILAPPDYQQGESYRIIFIHVPSAWLSLFIYMFMAVCAASSLIWRFKIADILAYCSAPIGALFTFLALLTGALWGKPMWGTYWVWDARLTSELILFFLYLGYMALYAAIPDRTLAARSSAILALVGVINIPIIHYSVEWWHTLHQGPTISRFDAPAIHWSMLRPLLLMVLAFKLYFLWNLLLRARAELLLREQDKQWVKQLVEAGND